MNAMFEAVEERQQSRNTEPVERSSRFFLHNNAKFEVTKLWGGYIYSWHIAMCTCYGILVCDCS